MNPQYPAPQTQSGGYPYPYPGQAVDYRESRNGSLIPGWMIAGAAAVAVGVWAYYALGPDIQRYLKIRSM